jgi:UDPglucose 6-dehydrogenase
MTSKNLRTAVVGAGYVGIATAVGLAERGHDVVLVEQDAERLATLTAGHIPFHEPGLPEAYATHHGTGRITPASGSRSAGPGDRCVRVARLPLFVIRA